MVAPPMYMDKSASGFHWPEPLILENLLSTGLLKPWLHARIEQCFTASSMLPAEELTLLQANTMVNSSKNWNSWCDERMINATCLNSRAKQNRYLSDLKRSWFENKAREYFLLNGSKWDQVYFSILQTNDPHLAQEWYFKILESEYCYADLAINSLGAERHTGGIIGPLRFKDLQTPFDLLLRKIKPAVIQPPFLSASGRYCVVRLEHLFSSRWDEPLVSAIIDYLYREWIGSLINSLLDSDPIPNEFVLLTPPNG